jgi:hypothetical protein
MSKKPIALSTLVCHGSTFPNGVALAEPPIRIKNGVAAATLARALANTRALLGTSNCIQGLFSARLKPRIWDPLNLLIRARTGFVDFP